MKTISPGFYVLVRARVIKEFRSLETLASMSEERVRRFVEREVRSQFLNLPSAVLSRVTNEITDALIAESRNEVF